MKPIAIFYHCKIAGDGIPDADFACLVMAEQMHALAESGLAEAATEIHVGVNGDDAQALLALALEPAKSMLHGHGAGARSELPTLAVLRRWLKPGWLVFYHHTKAVTHPGEKLYENWRNCMERACVWNWRDCVRNLETHYQSVGAHWLTPEVYGSSVKSPFWGGNFWWARSEYLLTLPALKEQADCREDFYLAENWIGSGPKRPLVLDYAPHWPDLHRCA